MDFTLRIGWCYLEQNHPLCSFCSGSETHDHLCFNCPYTSQVWGLVMAKLNVSWANRSWANWIVLLSSITGRTLRSITIKLAFTTSIYHIWMGNNLRKFQSIACLVAVVTFKICSMIRFRLMSLDKLPQGHQSNWFLTELKSHVDLTSSI